MGEANAPFLTARIVADVDVTHGGVVGRVAAGPALQVRVDASRVALQIDRAADRMVAPDAARRHRADDDAAAGGDGSCAVFAASTGVTPASDTENGRRGSYSRVTMALRMLPGRRSDSVGILFLAY